eukprot:258383_1
MTLRNTVCIQKWSANMITLHLPFHSFSTQSESSGQKIYNEEKSQHSIENEDDEYEYYDEYSDADEFEEDMDDDDHQGWEYDDQGVAHCIKTGQPTMNPPANELRLPT